MKSVGIDLAGVESRPTGLCVMNGYLRIKTWLLHTDDEIICRTVKSRPDIVAIDAPLALPRGRKSLAVRNNIHLRECDRELQKMGIRFLPITLGPMKQLTERGIQLKSGLEKEGLTVIETYPGAAQDILHIPRKGKGLLKLAEGLCSMGIRINKDVLNGDELDAITCALVGIMYLKGEYRR